jgi:hypothetical protein
MDINTATREELLRYQGELLKNLEEELSPLEIGSRGMTMSEYKGLREYMIRRLLLVNDRLLWMGLNLCNRPDHLV